MLNIPRYDSFGNPIPNRLMAADLGSTFDPMLAPNLDEQASTQEFGSDEDIRILAEILGLASNQPQQVQVDNPAHEAVNNQPRQARRVQQVRPELPTQQELMAELRRYIRQGRYVQQAPRISRVHESPKAPGVVGAQQQQPAPNDSLTEAEKHQKIDELKKQWNNLAMNYDIDDDAIFTLFEDYEYINSCAPRTILGIKSAAKRFCSYLRGNHDSGGIKNPQTQDVLNFIESIKSGEDGTEHVKFESAADLLSKLKPFFQFLNDFKLCKTDITKDLQPKDIRKIYGQETSMARIRRKEFKNIMKPYSQHTLDPKLFKKYIRNTDNKYPIVKKTMLQFSDYLAKENILQPGPNDVTMFLAKNPSLLKGSLSIQRFVKSLKEFFKQTSETKSPNGQILYPDIGGCLDSPYWIEYLLKKLNNPDLQLPEPNNSIVNDLKECIGLE